VLYSYYVYIVRSGDRWYDYETGVEYKGSSATVATPLTKIPVLQRGGSIISTQQRLRRSSAQMRDDPFTFNIALSSNGSARGDLYWDDGSSFKYQDGEYLYRRFSFEGNRLRSTRGDLNDLIHDDSGVVFNTTFVPAREGYSKDVVNTVERVIVLGYPKAPSKVVLIPEGTQSTSTDTVELRSVLGYEYDSNVKRLVIRKPNAKIAENWSILIE
jgi:alpha 1,3-glucosidase